MKFSNQLNVRTNETNVEIPEESNLNEEEKVQWIKLNKMNNDFEGELKRKKMFKKDSYALKYAKFYWLTKMHE